MVIITVSLFGVCPISSLPLTQPAPSSRTDRARPEEPRRRTRLRCRGDAMNFFSNRDGGMEKQLFDLKFTSKQLEKLASKSTKQEREELLKVKKALQKGDMDIARIHGQVCCNGIPACDRECWNAGAKHAALHADALRRQSGNALLTAAAVAYCPLECHPQPQHRQQLSAARISHGRGRISCRVGGQDEASDEADERGREEHGQGEHSAPEAGRARAYTRVLLTPRARPCPPRSTQVLASMDLEKIAAVMEQFEKSFDSLDLASATVEGAMGSATTASMPEEEVDALINQVAELHSLEVTSRAADASSKPVAQQVVEESQVDELEKRLATLRAAA